MRCYQSHYNHWLQARLRAFPHLNDASWFMLSTLQMQLVLVCRFLF
uniref:Uncharacterized protein n=1 Tax=Arundo donax TaxID=35708 RepID=A0A0A9BU45_ARUDO